MAEVSKTYTIVHANGTEEKVQLKADSPERGIRDHITTIYFTIGTVVLLMTAYLTYHNIKHLKNAN